MMETSSEPQANPYLSGPIAPLFFKTAAPIVLLMLVSGLFTVVDAIFLGVYVGPRALAAVTLAGSFFFVLFLTGAGFGWAVMPLVATAAAEGDETSARRATRMGLWLSLLYAALMMPLLLTRPTQSS